MTQRTGSILRNDVLGLFQQTNEQRNRWYSVCRVRTSLDFVKVSLSGATEWFLVSTNTCSRIHWRQLILESYCKPITSWDCTSFTMLGTNFLAIGSISLCSSLIQPLSVHRKSKLLSFNNNLSHSHSSIYCLSSRKCKRLTRMEDKWLWATRCKFKISVGKMRKSGFQCLKPPQKITWWTKCLTTKILLHQRTSL